MLEEQAEGFRVPYPRRVPSRSPTALQLSSCVVPSKVLVVFSRNLNTLWL